MRRNDTHIHVPTSPSGQRQHPWKPMSRKAPTLQAHRVIREAKMRELHGHFYMEDESQRKIKGHLVLKQNKT